MQTVSDHHYEGVAGVHLVEGVEAVGEGLVVQDEQEHHRLLLVPRLAVDEGDRTVLHLGSPHGLRVDVVELLYFEGRLAGDAHAFALAEDEDGLRLLGVEFLGEGLAVLLVVADGLQDVVGDCLELGPQLVDHLHGGVVLLLGHLGRELDEVEHLVEEALGGGHAGLPPHFDVDREVDLPRERRALHVDDPDRVDVLHRLQIVHDPDQVLRLSRLTDHQHCLVLRDVVGVQLRGVHHVELQEALEGLEEGLADLTSVVAGPAGHHRQVLSKLYSFFDSFKFWFELKLTLLSDFIAVKALKGRWNFL